MKLKNVLGLFAALSLGTGVLGAQDSSEIEKLRQQLQQVQENFRKAQQESQRQIESLMKQLEAVQQKQAAAEEKEKLKQQIEASLDVIHRFRDITDASELTGLLQISGR